MTQRQKFHTDDVNQCLHNKFGSHGVPNANLFNFTFLLVDFGKALSSSSNELQQNSDTSSREDYKLFHNDERGETSAVRRLKNLLPCQKTTMLTVHLNAIF